MADGEQGGDHKEGAGGEGRGGEKLGSHGLNFLVFVSMTLICALDVHSSN